MKKIIALAAVMLAAAAFCFAESVFAEFIKSDYTITESTSLGGSVSISSNTVVHQSSGLVEGNIQFNTKTKIIKFTGGRKIKYKQEYLVIKPIGHAIITSGKGILAGDGGEVSFQLIEDLRSGSINMIVKWPDFSSVRLLAELKGRTEL